MNDRVEPTAEYKFTGDTDPRKTLTIHNGTKRKNKVVVEVSTPGCSPVIVTAEAKQLFLISHLISGAISSNRDIEAEIKGDRGENIAVTYGSAPGWTSKVLKIGPLVASTQSEAQDLATLLYMAPEVLAH